MPRLPQHIPSLESESTWWERHYHWWVKLLLPHSSSLIHICKHMSRQWLLQLFAYLTPNMWKRRGRLHVSSSYYLYSSICYCVGGKFHKNSFFLLLFLSVFRHYKATAINSHRYKYHSLPLLDDLRFVFFHISCFFKHNLVWNQNI